MAGRKRDDFCLVCMESPCECKKARVVKEVKAARPALPVALPTVKPVKQSVPQPVIRPTRAGLGAVKKSPVRVAAPSVAKPTRLPPPRVDPEEEEMKRAITVIAEAGLLDEAEILKHRRMINLSDTQIRAILWKQKRGVNVRK